MRADGLAGLTTLNNSEEEPIDEDGSLMKKPFF
jgi:hypothetical protein